MRAGELRHRVIFQARSTSQDTYGGQTDTWMDFITVAASIVPTTGRELLAAQATQNESRFTITTRYFSGAVPSMRIVFGARIFNIIDTSNIEERNRELQFLCSEGLSQG